MATQPRVLVTDIRMPHLPAMRASKAARNHQRLSRGSGWSSLSQYDDPEYAVSPDVAEGSASRLRPVEGSTSPKATSCVGAVRAVQQATGGTASTPSIVEALVRPVTSHGGLPHPGRGEPSSRWVAEGKPHQGHRRLPTHHPEAVDARVRSVVRLAGPGGLRRATRGHPPAATAHQCIVDQGGTAASRCPALLPPRRTGREVAPGRATGHREDRSGRGHRPHEQHPAPCSPPSPRAP